MSDILRMLELFEMNHEFGPAAQRDIEEIIAAVRATPAPVAQKVPDGFVLVPKEPTAEMTLAGVREAVSHPRPNVYRIYRAMLAAQEGK